MIPDKRLFIITGNYGSGKTEFSVNFIKQLYTNGSFLLLAFEPVLRTNLHEFIQTNHLLEALVSR